MIKSSLIIMILIFHVKAFASSDTEKTDKCVKGLSVAPYCLSLNTSTLACNLFKVTPNPIFAFKQSLIMLKNNINMGLKPAIMVLLDKGDFEISTHDSCKDVETIYFNLEEKGSITTITYKPKNRPQQIIYNQRSNETLLEYGSQEPPTQEENNFVVPR